MLTYRPRLSVVTPTCNRPVALALARRWMAAQTLQPDEWIIADDSPHPPGAYNFLDNIERGLARATGDRIIFWEDDDYYHPEHLASMCELWDQFPEAQLVGDDTQRYYSLPYRRYKVMANKGASLCQTGMVPSLRPWFADVLAVCRALVDKPAYGFDTRLWAPVLRGDILGALAPLDTVVGVKGLPGQRGLGMGHNPERVASWAVDDPTYSTLHSWIVDRTVVADYLALVLPVLPAPDVDSLSAGVTPHVLPRSRHDAHR